MLMSLSDFSLFILWAPFSLEALLQFYIKSFCNQVLYFVILIIIFCLLYSPAFFHPEFQRWSIIIMQWFIQPKFFVFIIFQLIFVWIFLTSLCVYWFLSLDFLIFVVLATGFSGFPQASVTCGYLLGILNRALYSIPFSHVWYSL